MRRVRLLGGVVALVVALGSWTSPAAHADTPGAISGQPVLTGLNDPATFAFRPDGSIFYAERETGIIRAYIAGSGVTHVFYRVTNVTDPGVLGLAFDPHYPTDPYVYVYSVRLLGGKTYDQILKVTSRRGVGVAATIIFSVQTRAGVHHYGGPLAFGPGGSLYALVGDANISANSQNLNTALGKVLRMTPDGRAPGNNILGHRIFVRGFRNSLGMNFDPDTGKLWETENGPECNDEINQFANGENGGWGPMENCEGTSPDDTNNSGPAPRTLPLWWTVTTIAPTGMAFCPEAGCNLPGYEGHMFFGDYNQSIIHDVTLTPDRLGVASVTDAVDWDSPIFTMQRNPVNGSIYFSDVAGIYELVSS